jgi:serine/threonine protein kinase
VGTINYVAPEVAAHRPYSGPEADIWSLGTILLAMLTARMPFGPPEEDETRRNIERANYEVPRGASAAVLDLLARLLQPDPLRRATMADVLHHPWLRARDLEGEWGAEAPVCPPPPLAHGEAEGADRAGVGSYSSDDDPIPYSQLFPL